MFSLQLHYGDADFISCNVGIYGTARGFNSDHYAVFSANPNYFMAHIKLVLLQLFKLSF
jgi:hypothetical protein